MSQQSHPYRTNRDLFSNHYLTEHLRQTEPWQDVDQDEVRATYEEIRELWKDKKHRVEDYNESSLEDNFIRPMFDILGIPFEVEQTVERNARRPDYGFFPSEEAADAAYDRDDFYEEAIAVADAKYWGRKLDTRGEKKRDYENPSYQIHDYLMETPPQWGVLTNGKQWRLYYGPTSHRLDSYYEIDLPEILQYVEEDGGLQDFKDFYLFFRQRAFLPDQSGDCFLDDVYDESSVFAEAIGEDLQENIYEAIRVLAEGFLDTNDDLDEDNLPLIHDSSLIYLYRLIFVLYAESEGRDLLPTDNEIYSESYGLNELKREVTENRDDTQQHYQTWQTNLWDTLEELFILIDQGSQGMDIPKDQLYIPAYNGGLFRTDPDPDDTKEARFLATHEADDAHLAEVLDLLTRRDADEGDGQVFVDYSSLDERHLGSIYEGLLEYKLDVADERLTVEDGEYSPAVDDDEVAVAEGDVYLRTDSGERKATGSYYTPEYVVEYIVDETLEPLVSEIREDLVGTESYHEGGFAGEFADQVFNLKVLDPAMGSGHFLVNAVDYLAREIIDAQERQDQQAVKRGDEDAISDPRTDEGELRDINWARRKVAQQCIYGVDLNPLATELAKVSLWLRTLAAEQPLAFLDHHLKTGNSLIGSDIEDVLGGEDREDGQTQLTDWMDQTRQRALEHVMERFTDLLSIDNETLEDIKEMEEVYDEVRDDSLYQHLLAMANVHTAAEFELNVPDDAEKQMAEALRDNTWSEIEEKDWFRSAQALADEESFFHWELEFPVAFYDDGGDRLLDSGFDAIIGNPPYVRIQELNQTSAKSLKYLNHEYRTTQGKYDLYVPFVEQAAGLVNDKGFCGYILPNKFMQADYGSSLREFLVEEAILNQVVDFGDTQIFDDLSTYTAILILHRQGDTVSFAEDRNGTLSELSKTKKGIDALSSNPWNIAVGREGELLSDLLNIETTLGDLTDELFQGVITGGDDHFILNQVSNLPGEGLVEVQRRDNEETFKLESDLVVPFAKGSDIRRCSIERDAKVLLYPYRVQSGRSREIPEEVLQTDYPEAYHYLTEFEDELRTRGSESMEYPTWYSLWCPRDKWKFESSKILTPSIAKHNRFCPDDDQIYFNGSGGGGGGGYGIILKEDYKSKQGYVTAILNSSVAEFIIRKTSSVFQQGYFAFNRQYIEPLPIVMNPEKTVKGALEGSDRYNQQDYCTVFEELVEDESQARSRRNRINLNLLDYLGNYTEGPRLPEIGLFQPTSSNILDATTEKYDKLQVENARTKRDGSSVTIEATARYKPEDEDAFETDTWGYTETDYFEAFTLTDLSKKEAELVEAFVPLAVEEEIGGFRDNATKTNSLIDRMKNITLPDIDDIHDDLEHYIKNKEHAEELDGKIEKIDRLIDELIYDLYDLNEEEVEIVEEAVNGEN